ncbi:MAG: c-type cytochrome [Candidatus Nitrosoglobus sp.]|jgi:cytochrome c
MKHLLALLSLLVIICPTYATDANTIATHGNDKGAAPCVNCHGVDGTAQTATGIPQLAGLNAAYLLKQLNDFASGARSNSVMAPIATALSAGERQALATYYSQLPLSAALAIPNDDSSILTNDVGGILATRGRWSANIPACEQCHGPGGVGVGAHFPPLAGQPPTYLAAQLKAWKQGLRHNDPLDLMAHIAKKLDNADIDAVVNWFTTQSNNSSDNNTTTPQLAVSNINAKQPGQSSFTPPSESAISNDEFGAVVRQGREIFIHTQRNASAYVGNGLSCSNCHLDAGRLADSAPLWGAYGMYPQYRAKNKRVNTYIDRLQGCFLYSMNGKAPPADSEVLIALDAYSYWMATGATIGTKLAGAGFPNFKPAQPANYTRGQQVFNAKCAICHGNEGQGQQVAGEYIFPPLWGSDSYNWGAGMHQLDKAAGFIKANMPLGLGNSLSNQEAWDVAMFINAHERPQDPRYTGDLAETRKRYHDTPYSLYGIEVNGHLLGSGFEEH